MGAQLVSHITELTARKVFLKRECETSLKRRIFLVDLVMKIRPQENIIIISYMKRHPQLFMRSAE
jgi:hypothetical protein